MNAVLFVAVAIGDQIERIGAYFGFAAIIGLGVLSLLYFAQAREVKRLREWAGRAPERDAELAARVQTDAQKRVVAQPVPAASAAAAPGGPQTPAAQQADAARQAAAASVMQKFQTPGAVPAIPAVGPPGQLARPGGLGAPASGSPAAATPGLGSPAPGTQQPDKPNPGAPQPGQPAPASGQSPSSAPVPGPPVPPAPATAGAVAAARKAATEGRSPSIANGAGQQTHESAAARPPELPDLPSRAARATSTPTPDDDGPSRKKIGLIAGAGVAAVAIVAVLVLSLTGGSDAPPAANEIGPPSASSSPPPPPSSPTSQVDRKATPVAVLNGTTQTGLAGSVADKIEEQGFTINARTDNDDQTLTTTTVYYADESEPAARLVANIVGVQSSALESMDANNAAKVDPGTKVLVIVGGDVASAG